MIELECERCKAKLGVLSASTRAWHADCPKREARKVLPRYVEPKNAHASEAS